MFTSTILTSWAACPQSRLYHEVVATGDRRCARVLTQVARQWDHTLAPGWVVRLLPRRLQPAPFDAGAYRAVVRHLSVAALVGTLEHVEWLRSQGVVRGSLRSVAFLERFEGVVGAELDRRVLRTAPAASGQEPPSPCGLDVAQPAASVDWPSPSAMRGAASVDA
jgi:hypothetical protein